MMITYLPKRKYRKPKKYPFLIARILMWLRLGEPDVVGVDDEGFLMTGWCWEGHVGPFYLVYMQRVNLYLIYKRNVILRIRESLWL